MPDKKSGTEKKPDSGQKRPQDVQKKEPESDGIPGGTINMSDDVVATIAGYAVRGLPGIHSLGRSRLIPIGEAAPDHGVAAEVGEEEAALDLELTIEYGCDISEVARSVRQQASDAVMKMTGRKVVEVNIDVVGIQLPEPEEEEKEPERQRVQ